MPQFNSIIPPLTSATDIGYEVSESSYYNNDIRFRGWKIFDGNNATSLDGWQTNAVRTGWVKIKLPIAKKVERYSMSGGFRVDYNKPTAWTFEGSNTGDFSGEQVILDTRTNSTDITSAFQTVDFDINNTEEFRYYRINITATNQGDNIILGELTLYEVVYSEKVLVLNDSKYYKYNMTTLTWEVVTTSTPTEVDYDNGNTLTEVSSIPQSAWVQLIGVVELRYYTDNVSQDTLILDLETEPFSVYDYISETPEVIVYSESTDDITVSTTTEPFDLYDEFGDELEVLYYTDNEVVNEADLILEANYSPIDELEGNFEVVTLSPDVDVTNTLDLRSIKAPKLIHTTTLYNVGELQSIQLQDLSVGYGNSVKALLTPNNTDWYTYVNGNFKKLDRVDNVTINAEALSTKEVTELTPSELANWNFNKINVGVFLTEHIRTSDVASVSEIGISAIQPTITPKVSDASFYILNTTARIDIELQGQSVFGTLSDADSTRVQYRVSLNGNPYFPSNGEFTALTSPPENINITFSSDEVVIDDFNTVTVEFKDYFGTTDTWSTNFVGKYGGILFSDSNGELYSTDVGRVLKYLDFGNVVTGQVSQVYGISLKNQYGFNVKEVKLVAETSNFAEGLKLEFSKNEDFSDVSSELMYDTMINEESLTFYIRLVSPIETEPNGNSMFDIFVSAKRDV